MINPLSLVGSIGSGTLGQDDDRTELVPSGNSVQLEDELLKAADVRRSFELNTAIVRAFHQMMTMTTKGT